MRMWLVYFIVALLAYDVQSQGKYPAKEGIYGEKTSYSPYYPTTAAPPTTEEPCICTLEIDPVCGTDNVTYSNPCVFACAQRADKDLAKAHDGECEGPCPPVPVGSTACSCPQQVTPVCGSDGHTYDNFCMFCCAQGSFPGLTKAHNGAC